VILARKESSSDGEWEPVLVDCKIVEWKAKRKNKKGKRQKGRRQGVE
jgi:hypothetical protein